MAKVKKQTAQRKKARRVKKSRAEEGLLANIVPFESRGDLKISVYGDSGTGKTTFWSSFPGPILAILCSGGKGTNELDSVSRGDREKIEPYYLENCDDLLKLAEELSEDTHYKTIVIDHLSGIQDLRIAEILGLEEIPVQKNWGMAGRDEWTERALNMKTYLRRFLDLVEKKVVFVSQELSIEPQEGASDLDILPSVGPYLSGSVVEWFNPACNFIVRTFIKQRTKTVTTTVAKKKKTKEVSIKGKFDYCLMTGPSDIYTTKFRMPKEDEKPSYIVNPTYEKIMGIIKADF